MDILFASPVDWQGVRGRFQHLAVQFADFGRVLYMDGIGLRPIALQQRDFVRMAHKLESFFSPGKKEGSESNIQTVGLSVASPLVLPFNRNRLVRTVNKTMLLYQVRRKMAQIGMQHPLLWLAYPHPDWLEIIDSLCPRAVVYDCVDDWEKFSGFHADLVPSEHRLVSRADLVIATSPTLRDRLIRGNSKTFLVPNGVDIERFTEAPHVEQADLASIPHPRVGFVGNIAEWVDMKMVYKLARRRPEWQFVMIGPWQRPESPLSLQNLHLLGERHYQVIPSYLTGFDACFIPFEESELTRAVDPLKLYEYLAAGQPTVSTPLPSVAEDLATLVYWASGAEAMADALNRALAEPLDQAMARRNAAAKHSWSARAQSIVDLLNQHLGLDMKKACQ